MDETCQFNEFNAIINPTTSVIGIIFSSFIIVILINPLFKDIVYIYLKIQTCTTILNLLIKALQPVYYCCEKCEISKERTTVIFYIGFIVYMSSILEMMAQYSCVFSGLYCCLLIWNQNNKARFIQDLLSHYKIITFVLFIFSAVIFCFQLFIWKLEENEKGFYPRYKKGDNWNNILITTNVLRDGVSLLALLIITIILVYKLRKIMEEKLELLNKNFLKKIQINNRLEPLSRSLSEDILASNSNKPSIFTISQMNSMKINKIKKRQTVTIMTTCLNCFLGRLPILIAYATDPNNKNEGYAFGACAFMIYLSNCITFFLVYFSNEKFKRIFKKYFFKVDPKQIERQIFRSNSH